MLHSQQRATHDCHVISLKTGLHERKESISRHTKKQIPIIDALSYNNFQTKGAT